MSESYPTARPPSTPEPFDLAEFLRRPEVGPALFPNGIDDPAIVRELTDPLLTVPVLVTLGADDLAAVQALCLAATELDLAESYARLRIALVQIRSRARDVLARIGGGR